MLKLLKTNLLPATIILVMMAGVSGCRKKDDPPAYQKPDFMVTSGDHQTGYFGAILPDSVEIKVVSHSSIPYSEYRVMFRSVSGNGGIIHFEQGLADPYTTAMINSQWTLKVPWSLGCDRPDQAVRFYLFFKDGVNAGMKGAMDSVTVSATALKPVGWARSCGPSHFYNHLYDVVFHSSGNKVFMLCRGMIFSSADQGINWTKLAGYTGSSNVVDFQFNSAGWMYILNGTDGMSFSSDLKNWQTINNGIKKHYTGSAFLVEDSVLYVFYDQSGFWRSRNNGQSWQSIPKDWYKCTFIRRHPNGSIYLYDDWPSLYRLDNIGDSWQRYFLNPAYLQGKVHGMAIDPAGNLVTGSENALLSVLEPTTLTGEAHSYFQPNGLTQFVNYIHMRNGVTYYLVNGNESAGIYSSDHNWNRLETGFTRPVQGFFPLPGTSFLLASDDGIYYYSQ